MESKQNILIRRFYRGDDWKIDRAMKIATVGGRCEKCGAIGTEVHHIIHLTPENVTDPSISLNQDNLLLFCNECNNNDHSRFEGSSNYGIGISEGITSVPEVNVKYDDISRLVIQADIDISSGNSGGALLNEKGYLIGITTFRTKDIQGNVNYGFTYSIPLKTIKKFWKEG